MSTIKIGWGTRIAVIYVGFIVLIVLLVTGSMRQKVDLVSNDYYEQELRYQDVIDAGRNEALLSAPVVVRVIGDQLQIAFSDAFTGMPINGTISFYAPANSGWDQDVPFVTDKAGVMIDISKLHPTTYTAKISWSCNNIHYYKELNLNLSHHE